jgi:hypothetical protein
VDGVGYEAGAFVLPTCSELPKPSELPGSFVDLSSSFMEHSTTLQRFVERGYTPLT